MYLRLKGTSTSFAFWMKVMNSALQIGTNSKLSETALHVKSFNFSRAFKDYI